jgi:predicted HNH restriction endonuclease
VSSRISEADLVLPALFVMSLQPNKTISTSDLIKSLTKLLKPTGEDAEILKGRKDTKFSQKVRNLRSHETLERLGYAKYFKINNKGYFKLTEMGEQYLKENIELIQYLLNNPFEYNEMKNLFGETVKNKGKRKIDVFDENIIITEGSEKIIHQRTYERSKKLREYAIEHYKKNGEIICDICCFNFKEFYGKLGEGFIEIHHLKPVFMFEGEDLNKKLEEALKNVVPVCSNCHRIIHRNKMKPVSIETMKKSVNKNLYFCN